MRKSSNITFYPKWVYYVMETYRKCDIFKSLCLQELLEFSQVELSLELHSIVIALWVSWIAWLSLRKMSHETSYSGKAWLHAQVLEIKASAHTPHNKPFFFLLNEVRHNLTNNASKFYWFVLRRGVCGYSSMLYTIQQRNKL